MPDDARKNAASGKPRGSSPASPFLRETSQKPGVPEDGSPGDEIARAMPGLPLALKELRVDKDGFHRGKTDVEWSRVTSVTACGRRVSIEGTNEKGSVKRLLHVKVGPQAARAVESLWSEVCFRRVQRDGELLGRVSGWKLRRRVWCRSLVAALLLLLATRRGYVLLGSDAADGAVADLATMSGGDGGAGLSTDWGVVVLLAWLGAGLAMIALATGRRSARVARWWSHWRLGRDGLSLRDEEGNEKRLVLAKSIVVTPVSLRASDEAVSFRDLTARPVFARLYVAMTDRAGAASRTLDLRSFARGLLSALVLFVPGPAMVVALVWGWMPAALTAVGMTIVVLVVAISCCVRVHTRMQGVLTRTLKDGSALLKRIGW